MKITRALLAAFLVALATAACSADATGPRADDCPMLGAGVPSCE